MRLRYFAARDGTITLPAGWEPIGFVADGVWCRWVDPGDPSGEG
jgi:hypothetical protein